jgi:hypothetical protein
VDCNEVRLLDLKGDLLNGKVEFEWSDKMSGLRLLLLNDFTGL